MTNKIPPVKVNAKSLYNYMKHILNEFGLEFAQMDLIELEFTPHTVCFSYDGMTIESSNIYINRSF